MTRKEFLEQAAGQAFFSNEDTDREGSIRRIRKMTCFANTDPDFLINFLYSGGLNGYLIIARYEKKSGDLLHIDVRADYDSICFWEDIGQYVCMVAYIRSCAFSIEKIYLSEDGRFWDEHHKLIFTTEEELFDHLITAEFDYHPVISEKTYEMLRHFGWYEGRRVDTTELEKELKKHGIVLTEIQLDAIREFSGLEFSFSCSSKDEEFYTPEEMIERINNDDLYFDPVICDINKNVMGRNVFEFGSTDVPEFSIDEDGKIFVGGFLSARTVMEYIHWFCEHLGKNVDWL